MTYKPKAEKSRRVRTQGSCKHCGAAGALAEKGTEAFECGSTGETISSLCKRRRRLLRERYQ